MLVMLKVQVRRSAGAPEAGRLPLSRALPRARFFPILGVLELGNS